ncbi:hypothetical protein NOF04DRAFT_1363343 [Fusarium oxysporum II5]|nr:hypothetical protein NOF04DRAFT_1363343 [Fusarium oxysporum II5]
MAVNDEKPALKRRKTYSNPFQEYLEENCCAAPAMQGDDSLEPFEDEYQHWISNHDSGDAQVRDPLAYWHEKRAGIIRDLDPFFVSVAEEKDNLKMAHMTDDELQEWATAWLENVVECHQEESSWE